MLPTVRLLQAAGADHYRTARSLIEEYAADLNVSIGVDLAFQNFSAELEHLAECYGPPSGCLLLASSDDEWLGCCALRQLSPEVCEMKRLYIKPQARGANLARRLSHELLSQARTLGYRRMVLDTLGNMTAAQALYRSLGFRDTAPYYFNPLPGVIYMELAL
jgi:putative acetyltransferase